MIKQPAIEEPKIEQADAPDGGSILLFSGPWVMETAPSAASALDQRFAQEPASTKIASVSFDLSKVEAFDTAGLWLVVRQVKRLEREGIAVTIIAGSKSRQSLLQVLTKACDDIGLAEMAAPPSRPPFLVRYLADVGRKTIAVGSDILEILSYLGASVWSLAAALFAPDRLRMTAIMSTLDQAGLKAVFIIALMAFLIGAIICQQSAFYLRYYGGEIFTVDLVGTLVLREIGVLITAIMVAGRSGSAITAELGSMKMRDEIDALKVAGLDPLDVLVVPRLISLIIALPLLTIVANGSAMLGAMAVSASYSGIQIETFWQRLGAAVDLQVALIGLVKAPFMALAIGLIACMEGMKVAGSATSLGQRTTLSVVKAIFTVIVLDGVFAMIFAAMAI